MSPNIAIVTRMLTVKGGAELAILELAKNFDCDIFTTNFNPNSTFREFSKLNVYSSPLLLSRNLSLFIKFLRFPFIKKLREYDLIITSSGFYPKLIAVHRYLPPVIHYEQSPTNFGIGFARLMSPLDFYVTRRIRKLVANSKNTRNKLERRYRRKCDVIYPPVRVEKFKNKPSEDFFLSVQRITPDKRVDIQIEAFKRLPYKLIVVGSSYNPKYFNELKRIAPSNVEFRINVKEEELIELYSKCRAVIQTSKDEHFGLVPVESMAAGKPCIAVNEGGFRETVQHGKTGILLKEPYVENLIKAIKELDKYDFNPRELRKRAEEFSVDRFLTNFWEVFNEVLEGKL